MTADVMLSRLDAVREIARGRWRARCPAHHGDNRDVLSIGETGDGTVLIKCFAGCTATDIVCAVGLELHDLFPRTDWQASGKHAGVGRQLRKYDRDEANHPHLQSLRRPRIDWAAFIAACERDMLLVKIILMRLAKREPISDDDATACQSAATRVYGLIREARNG